MENSITTQDFSANKQQTRGLKKKRAFGPENSRSPRVPVLGREDPPLRPCAPGMTWTSHTCQRPGMKTRLGSTQTKKNGHYIRFAGNVLLWGKSVIRIEIHFLKSKCFQGRFSSQDAEMHPYCYRTMSPMVMAPCGMSRQLRHRHGIDDILEHTLRSRAYARQI